MESSSSPTESGASAGSPGAGGSSKETDECPDDPCVQMPGRVLLGAVAWTVTLLILFFLYEEIDAIADFFPTKLGPLPFTSVWFGGAGGLLISLQGIFSYNRRWRRSYDYWHYMRPIVGALIGTLGCLMFVVLNDAATTKHPPANSVFYAVIAFVIGYREESFRTLVARLVDTIIVPSDKSSAAANRGGGGSPPGAG